LQERSRTGHAHSELTFVRKDGSRFEGEVSSSVFAMGDGEVRTSMIIREITERKRLESELWLQNRAMNASGEGICITTSTETGNLLLYANDAFERITGYSRAEVLGRNMRLLQGPETDSAVLQQMREALCAGREFSGEVLNYRKDGKAFWNRLTISPVRNNGTFTHFISIFTDITARKERENELARSREALRALMARLESVREEERILISREIHDELGHAITDLKLDLAWLARKLEKVGFSGRTAIRKRLSSMSLRLDRNAQAIRRIATQLRPAILDALGLAATLKWQARDFQARTGIRCEVEITNNLPSLETRQATGLFRAFQEILTNVARHAQASKIVIRLAAPECRIVLEVEDDGRGISAEESARPTALGLLGVRERMALLGGDVVIQGCPGLGTKVILSIPVESHERR
jgi:PAS domain S-box-containing protein